MASLTKLFEPGRIGRMELSNRLVMAPMGVGSADEEGYMNQRTVDYYVERAAGGVGLIVVQGASVISKYRFPHILGLWDDKYIPGMKQLADAVHVHGVKIAAQIMSHPPFGHRKALESSGWLGHPFIAEMEFVGPSAIPYVTLEATPRELSREEIHQMVEAHGEAARRAQEAGYDAVDIHAAHGYQLSAFLTPFLNKRQDEYGGSVENRARFACEIVRAVRKKVGPDFPVIIRMSGSDFLEGGLTLEEAIKQAVMFAEAGADALDISVAVADSRQWRDLTYMHPDGAIIHLAAGIKKAVKVPVIGVGKIGDPVLADRFLREGKADFIAMARPLLVDAELPRKAREGRLDDIRKCIFCNNCRLGHQSAKMIASRGTGIACTVNPELLREREFKLKPAAKPKKVMVIGGGLAGMEAAMVLAERGHKVRLYERDGELGGQWNTAAKQPSKAGFASLKEFLLRGIKKTRVEVTLNTAVTREMVEAEKPDAVVVATGTTPHTLAIPGIGGKNVVRAVDVFTGKARVGERAVVVGGRLIGMEVADLLATQGKKVTLVTKNRLGEDGVPLERNIFVTLRDKLVEQGIPIFPFSPVYEIREDGIYVAADKELMFLKADTVVMAIGAKSENRLVEELKGVVPEVYAIGDCVEPRNAREATNEGAEVARKI